MGGPGLSIFRFRRPYATFSSCRNLSGIQFKCRSEGGYFTWTSAFPTRLIKQVWYGQMIRVSTVTTCAYKWGPGSGTKMGKERAKQRRNYLLLPRTTSYSGWLVSKQHPKVD